MNGPQLLVIRHGQTEWSAAGRHTGRTDIALTEVGRAEAHDAGRALAGWSIARAYASPLRRARETAEIVDCADHLEFDDDLMEWDYGRWEGRTTGEAQIEIPDWSVWTQPDGETVEQLGERADRFLARVVSETPFGNVAVFSHGHVLAVLIARWCGLAPIEGRRFYLATATVSLLSWHRSDRVIKALNHRAGDLLDPPDSARNG